MGRCRTCGLATAQVVTLVGLAPQVSYAGGVILGADSRTSNGNYIANRVTDKITPLADKVGGSQIVRPDRWLQAALRLLSFYGHMAAASGRRVVPRACGQNPS